MDNDCTVIGIAGISGAGKSTVVNRLADLLEDASVIYFDDYTTFEAYPMLDDTLARYFGLAPTDTPLEISLARMIMRDIANIDMDQMSREEAIGQLKSVKMLVESYFTVRRPYSQALID